MISKVKQYIIQNNLPQAPAKLLVGVSGGADSVALLHILVNLGYRCEVAHCNFNLRDTESNRDETFVENLAEKLSLSFHKINFDTKQYAAQHKISIEMAARELRYNWFEKLLQETNAEGIAIAHHADDVVETLLMNLTRGTSIRGLSGIKPRQGNIIRPLLNIWRKEIEFYLQENNIDFVTDSSNWEQVYIRNKFRHSVIPLLEEISPNVKEILLYEVERFKDVEILYNERIAQLKNEIVCNKKDIVSIKIQPILQHKAGASILYEILTEYGFSPETIRIIYQNLTGEAGKQFFSLTHRVLKDRDLLLIAALNLSEITKNISVEKNKIPCRIDVNNSISIDFKIILKEDFILEKNKNTAYFDADLLEFPLLFRRWQEGDTFVPFGMTGMKKVSDYFIDEKFSILQKEQTPLLLSGKNIIWIVGERTDNRYRIIDQTRQVLQVKIHRNG